MKKLFALMLVVAMVATLGLSAVAEELSGTLSILSWYDETKSEPVINAFKAKYPNVTVDYTYAPPVADYVEKLSTLLYTGSAPDVFYMALENREALTVGGYTMDLSGESYMQDGTIPDAVKEMYENCAAVDCWVGGLFYNKDMFAACGIESEPQTWEEFLNVCQTLQDNGYVPLLDNCQDAAVNFAAPLLDFPDKRWKMVVDLQLESVHYLSHLVAAVMAKQGGGKIINVASALSFAADLNATAYTVAKHGIVGMTRSYAAELGKYNITCNAIAPGFFETAMNGSIREANPALYEKVCDRTTFSPEGRGWGDTFHLMGTIVFLSSPASDYINGDVIVVDGGFKATMA